MARLGISLDLGEDLEKIKKEEKKIEKKLEKPEKKEEPTFDSDKKAPAYVLPLFLVLLVISGLITLTLLSKLTVIDREVKDTYQNILKQDLQKQIETDYARASDEEKQKILTRDYFEARNSVEFLKEIFTTSKFHGNDSCSRRRTYSLLESGDHG